MLYNLHLLRVIAALGVVYVHITSKAGLGLDWDIGSRGVDVFFVISGFIIAYIGTSKPEQFFRRRLIRVVPFYWAATLFVFAMVVVAPRMFHTATSSVPHLVSSLLFIPRQGIDGEMQPTLLLGWSLNFEMFFYVLFAMSLRISPRWSPAICVSWIVAFVLAIHAFASGNAIMDFYARPIVLEFCYGIAVFYLFTWCSARKQVFEPIAALKWLLLAVLVGNLIAHIHQLANSATHQILEMSSHVDLLGLLFIVWGLLTTLVGASMLALGVGAAALITSASRNGGGLAAGITAAAFITLAVIAIVWGAAHVIVGVPLRQRQPRARLIALSLGSVDLLLLPYGTALGLYGLWVLLHEDGKALFIADRGSRIADRGSRIAECGLKNAD
jgi:peptidoglycan/LPS O-acetylase OafA/YrhL